MTIFQDSHHFSRTLGDVWWQSLKTALFLKEPFAAAFGKNLAACRELSWSAFFSFSLYLIFSSRCVLVSLAYFFFVRCFSVLLLCFFWLCLFLLCCYVFCFCFSFVFCFVFCFVMLWCFVFLLCFLCRVLFCFVSMNTCKSVDKTVE